MRTCKAIGILALLLSVPALAKDADQWVVFSNTRFGTLAEIPNGLFKAQQPPANGDGRTFRSKDGAEVLIYGNYNTEETFEAYKNWLWDLLPRDRIRLSYKTSGKHWQARPVLKDTNSHPAITGEGWLAYSGYLKGDIVYHKQIEGCGALHSIHATYPRALKTKYDPVVSRIAGALRCETPIWNCPEGKGYCTTNVSEYDDGVVWPD